MVVQAIIPIAIAATGAIANYMSTQSGLAQQRVMQAQASDEEKQSIARAMQMMNQMKSPDYDGISKPSVEDLKIVGKYFPEVYQYLEEKAPELVTETGSSREKQLQQNVLNELQTQSFGSGDIQAESEMALAQQQAASQGASARANILRDMAARGAGGSGTELLAQLASGQSEENAVRQAALQARAGADSRRRQALGDLMHGATSLRATNLDVEKSNKDTINSFNQRMAMNRNSYNQWVANQQNEAQMKNLSEQQRVADTNTLTKNQMELNRYNEDVRRREAAATLENDKITNKANYTTGHGASTAQALRDSGKAAAQTGVNQGALFANIANAANKGIEAGSEKSETEKSETKDKKILVDDVVNREPKDKIIA